MRPSVRARRAALALHLLLAAALPFVAGPAGAVLALPLLIPLPGLWRGRLRTFAWCSFLVLFYLGGFLMEAFAVPSNRPVATGLAVIAALEFAVLLLHIRFTAAERRATTAG